MTMMTTIKEWQDGYFSAVKRIEEPMLKFAEGRADRFAKLVPDRPSFLADLPKTTELMESQLKFRKRFVDEQIAFTRKMMKTMHPVFAKFDTVAKPVEPKAAKSTAAKSTVTRMATRKAA